MFDINLDSCIASIFFLIQLSLPNYHAIYKKRYKTTYYYWEVNKIQYFFIYIYIFKTFYILKFVKIVEKLLITFFINFYDDEIVTKGILVLIVILIYY